MDARSFVAFVEVMSILSFPLLLLSKRQKDCRMCGPGSGLSLTSPFSFSSFVEFVEVISILYFHSKRQKDYILIGWSFAFPLFFLILWIYKTINTRSFHNSWRLPWFCFKETKQLQHLVLCSKDNEFHAAFSIPMDAYSFVEFVEVMSVLSFHSKRQEDFIQRTGNLLAFLSHAIKGHERRNQTNVDGKTWLKLNYLLLYFKHRIEPKEVPWNTYAGWGVIPGVLSLVLSFSFSESIYL